MLYGIFWVFGFFLLAGPAWERALTEVYGGPWILAALAIAYAIVVFLSFFIFPVTTQMFSTGVGVGGVASAGISLFTSQQGHFFPLLMFTLASGLVLLYHSSRLERTSGPNNADMASEFPVGTSPSGQSKTEPPEAMTRPIRFGGTRSSQYLQQEPQRQLRHGSKLSEADRDLLKQANSHRQQGELALRSGQLDEAQGRLALALPLYEATGARRQQAKTHQLLAQIAQGREQLDDAKGRLTLALQLYEATGSRQEQANTHHLLGLIARLRDDYGEAEHQHTLALQLYEATGNRRQQAQAQVRLSEVASRREQFDAAADRAVLALQLFEEVGDRQEQANAQKRLGVLHLLRDQFDEAEHRLNLALRLYEEVGDRQGKRMAHWHLAEVARRDS